MTTLLSKPVTLLVRAQVTPPPPPPPPAGQPRFGNGNATGSLNGDVWTPGRDANGLVNQVSWDLVPRRRGIWVAGSKLAALDGVVKAAIPAWRDYGTDGWDGVMQAWNGFTIDTAGSRLWLMAAGGHAAASNNGIYRFDAFKMAWAVEKMPSDPTPWSAYYKGTGGRGGTFTYCSESDAEAVARAAAGTLKMQNDYFYDELYWDNRPTSRHVYSASAYIPQTNELIMSTRRLWRYSLTTGEWTLRRRLKDIATQHFAGSGTWAIYDEVAQEYLHGGAGDGLYNTVGYKVSSNTWTNWNAPWAIYGVADARHGRQVTILATPERSGGLYAKDGQYWVYDLDSRTVALTGKLQYAQGLSRDDFPPVNYYYDGYALCYVASINRYWLCTRMNDGSMPILEIDPTTTPWTVRRQPLEGVVPRPHQNLCRKLVYLPGLNAVVMGDAATKDMWIYKF